MTLSASDPASQPAPRRRPNLWSAGAVLIAALVLAPILSVLGLAFFPEENIWPHLISTTLPRYLGNTAVLMAGTGLMTACMGTGAAWLVARYDFPGRRWLEWLLLLPLAIPAYVGAYALVDFLEYAGPVQTALRDLFGWQSARDYWFPQIRSMGAAIVVLSAALYPYVYLLTRNAFREQSGSAEEVAQSLGAGAFARFRRIGLPLARPAIAAGVAIVMMEAVNDFGTVDYFAVQTLTTGIFSVWLQSGNAGGAAQIACVILVVVVLLVSLERTSRRRMRFFNLSTRHRPVLRKRLTGRAGLAACLACGFPFALGFVLPVGVILEHAFDNAGEWTDPQLVRAGLHTMTVGAIAAAVTVAGGVFMVYGVRLSGRRLPRLLMPITSIGYAAPGAVLGVGILIPLAAIDNAVADAIENATGVDIGLVMTGSAFALVLAYFVRFFAIAQGAADAAMGRVSPNLPLAARSLGRSEGQVLGAVYYPLIRSSVASALLLVFVDCVKELPATLLLRPFNYETLATRVHQQASLENLGGAAPAAVLVILVGLIAVGMLARANR
ncbi:iron ABC transporter permease [Roseivivax halodurans JCM 10272]|uniref:Iron ABC transporter permease n=1 Tax=Roseivivax halodurans JCM 10272 TaxID=1449350 RepID=X7EF65_9RHOB|nr:iron ABC transporter permease [Roseivivax halodurans]ETX14495.1 iron ABC transporter permease [Roseivivax halodurans JCM 10272]